MVAAGRWWRRWRRRAGGGGGCGGGGGGPGVGGERLVGVERRAKVRFCPRFAAPGPAGARRGRKPARLDRPGTRPREPGPARRQAWTKISSAGWSRGRMPGWIRPGMAGGEHEGPRAGLAAKVVAGTAAGWWGSSAEPRSVLSTLRSARPRRREAGTETGPIGPPPGPDLASRAPPGARRGPRLAQGRAAPGRAGRRKVRPAGARSDRRATDERRPDGRLGSLPSCRGSAAPGRRRTRCRCASRR